MQLICVSVFTYANSRFSHDVAHFIVVFVSIIRRAMSGSLRVSWTWTQKHRANSSRMNC